METFINEDAVSFLIKIINKLITTGHLDDAFEQMENHFSPVSGKIATPILLNRSSFNELTDKIDAGTISDNQASADKARIKNNLINIMGRIPEELEIKRMLGKSVSGFYQTTSEENLEKILGPVNHLVKINWLLKAILASKSVCQVVRSDGGKGTGFSLTGGYVMTNCHVLPNKEKASTAKIVFDYEEDLYGNLQKTSEFFLEADDSKFSPVNELDYALIRIRDNPFNPVSKWGFLEFDTFSDPQVNNPVTIIQHPLGQTKQIALTANKIIAINGYKLFYLTDTERGSSGSPVFNNDWKVVALHHAGKTEEEGGLLIDPETGGKRGANEGILIKEIVKHLG